MQVEATSNDEDIDSDPRVVYTLSVLLAINAILSVAGNLLVVYTFIQEKPLGASLRVILTHLAVTNLIIAGIGEPMVVISGFSMKWVFGEMGRAFEAFIVTSCGLMAMSLLGLVSIERYVRVTPRQSFTMSEPTAVKACTGLWIFTTAYASLPFYGIAAWKGEGIGISNSISWQTDKVTDFVYIIVMMATGYFIPLFIIAFCYNRILFFVKQAVDVYEEKIAVEHGGQETTMETNLTVNTNDNASSNQANASGQKISRQVLSAADTEDGPSASSIRDGSVMHESAKPPNIIKAAERKISHLVALIIMSFFISWTPYMIVNLLVTFDEDHIFSKGIHATVPAFLAKTCTLWSPIIYCAMNGEVRVANMKTLNKLKRKIRILYFGGRV